MDTELRIDYRDTEAQFAELQRRMAEDGCAQLPHYMRSAPDFYFDEMSQILMDRWSRGRVALVSDVLSVTAASFLAAGPASAPLGAYILPANSRPVTTTNSDSPITTPNFAGFVERNQWLVSDNIPGGAPRRRVSSNESCIPSRSRTTERLHPGAARMALVGQLHRT